MKSNFKNNEKRRKKRVKIVHSKKKIKNEKEEKEDYQEDFWITYFFRSRKTKGSEKERWLEAIEEEKKSLKHNKVWTLVPREEAREKEKRILSNKWIFRVKDDGRYKARIVVRGCEQKYGFDYEETFSPVVNMSSLRLVLALAVQKMKVIEKFDVKTAFLNGNLSEDIYMEIPERFSKKSDKICKLKKALYGLKQAPLRWNQCLTDVLKSNGMKPTKVEPCIFVNRSYTVILALYVDDGIVIGTDSSDVEKLISSIGNKFIITRDFNPTSFLGIQFRWSKNQVKLKQTEYAKTLIINFGMENAKISKIPMTMNEKDNRPEDLSSKFPYRECVGSILYLASKTRSDLSYASGYDAAAILAPLNGFLTGKKKKDKQAINWTTESEEAFRESKKRLAEATLLAHPLENAKLIIKTDASNNAMGAVLEQQQAGNWKPLGFFSKKLSETQQKYSTYDRELLAMYSALKFFRHMVEGQDVTILTDHKPLQYAFQQPLDKASERQRRQLSFISEITTEIIYVAGKENTVADTLSRVETINMPIVVTTDELYEEQQKDEELQTLLRSKTALTLKKLRLDDGDKAIYCDVTDQIRKIDAQVTKDVPILDVLEISEDIQFIPLLSEELTVNQIKHTDSDIISASTSSVSTSNQGNKRKRTEQTIQPQYNRHFAAFKACEELTVLNFEELLKNYSIKSDVALQKFQKEGMLTDADRSAITEAVSNTILKLNSLPTASEYNIAANKICELFPCETKESYYCPPVGKHRNALGKLPDKIKNIKYQIKKAANPSTSYSGTISSFAQNERQITHPAKLVGSCNPNNPVIKTAITCLKHDSTESWPELLRNWSLTHPLRFKYLRETRPLTSHSESLVQASEEDSDVSVNDYFKLWNVLQLPNAYLLIQQDFRELYPGREDGLISKWDTTKKPLINLLKAEISKSDQYGRKLLTDCIATDTNKNDVILFHLLPSFCCKRTRGASVGVPSVAEATNAFILHVRIPGDLNRQINAQRKWLANKGLSLQPMLIFVGQNLSDITASYVQIDTVRYQLRTPLKALDTCFKAFQALDAAYPEECQAVWLFIQKYFYSLYLEEDEQIPRVTNVLSSLNGLVSKINSSA
ncbi:PREDICTED: uncharacterized protein LOC105457091 [Wasmannia auropunctata]|uniref:uncharacterized protein LOC105457091 n=1 Tax=Wasmannia auropunctata TaxID=64793 RepID=UPI0005EF35C0|nr:PREDICTED: uncharacterized protein LOC105457091 [Wasmannia auropunctata]